MGLQALPEGAGDPYREQKREPFAIRRPAHSPLPFAGLWETWQDLETFTIITTAANKPMRAVHDRMPLILSDEQIDEWLDPENHDPKDVLASLPSDELELVPVSGWVNNARHDDPRCLEPRSLPSPVAFFEPCGGAHSLHYGGMPARPWHADITSA